MSSEIDRRTGSPFVRSAVRLPLTPNLAVETLRTLNYLCVSNGGALHGARFRTGIVRKETVWLTQRRI